MATLDDVDHAAIGHVIEMVRKEAHGRALTAGIDRDIHHRLLFVRIQLLGGQQCKSGFGLLTGEGKATRVRPATTDAIRHGFRGFRREGGEPGRVIAQMARGDFNRATSGDCQKRQSRGGEQGLVTHGLMLREHAGSHNPGNQFLCD